VREAAVGAEARAGTVPQLAEDVGPGFAGEEFGEFLARELELRLVLRVDGDEFAAGGAWRVLRVAHQEDARTAQKLERQSAGDAVVVNPIKHALGVVQTRRNVDLPALWGQGRAFRCVHQPISAGLGGPAGRDGTLRGGELPRARVCGQRVVEQWVDRAVRVVPFVHPGGSLGDPPGDWGESLGGLPDWWLRRVWTLGRAIASEQKS